MIYLFVSFNIIIFTNGYFTAMHVWTVNFNITYTIEMYVDIIAKFPRAQLWMTSSLIVCKRVIKLINHIRLNCFWMSTCIKYSSQTLTIIEMYSIEYYFYIMHLESRKWFYFKVWIKFKISVWRFSYTDVLFGLHF